MLKYRCRFNCKVQCRVVSQLVRLTLFVNHDLQVLGCVYLRKLVSVRVVDVNFLGELLHLID